MDKIKFMEENNIAIFVEIDLNTKRMNIERRYEVGLENYDLFDKLIVNYKNLDNYKYFMEDEEFPLYWKKSKVLCMFSKVNNYKMVALLFETDLTSTKSDKYLEELDKCVEELDNKVKNMYNK